MQQCSNLFAVFGISEQPLLSLQTTVGGSIIPIEKTSGSERCSTKKVILLIGNYGSGKTEIALNMAFRASAEGKRTQVIDLDRINDYFRMSDHVKLLDEKKIDLVSPTFAGAGVTQTNMPAAVGSAFAQDWDLVIFDVGGDPAGSLSLARYHSDFAALEPGQLEVYNIVNVCRPMSETPDKIMKLMHEMEGFARQKVTASSGSV